MKAAKDDIIETSRANNRYYLSIVQKQNDSGIFFNQRILFLLPDHHIGYISQVKMDELPEKINFQKSKYTIFISNIKKLIIKENLLTIKYEHVSQNKKIEKIWILKMNSQILNRKWYDKINKEMKALEIKSRVEESSASKTIERSQTKVIGTQHKPKLTINTNDQAKVSVYEQSYPSKQYSKQKNLSINRSLSYSRVAKPQKVVKEVGTVITPKNLKTINQIQQQPKDLPILKDNLLQSKQKENFKYNAGQTEKNKKQLSKINQQQQQDLIKLNQIRQSQKKQVQQYKKRMVESKQKQMKILQKQDKKQYAQQGKRQQQQAQQNKRQQFQYYKRKQLQSSYDNKRQLQTQNNKKKYVQAQNNIRKQEQTPLDNKNTKRQRQLQQSRIYIKMMNQTNHKILLEQQQNQKQKNQQKIRLKKQQQRLQQQKKRIIQKYRYKDEQKQKQKQQYLQKQKQIKQYIQRQKQKQRQKQIIRQRQKQIERSRLKTRQLQQLKIKEIQKSRQKQIEIERSRLNLRQIQQLKQKEIQKLRQQQIQKKRKQQVIINNNNQNQNQNLVYIVQNNKFIKLQNQIAENPSWKDIPWTYKYLKYDYLIFDQFQKCAQELMKEAINRYINKTETESHLLNEGIFKYKKRDLQIKIALIQLIQIHDPQKYQKSILCNKKNVRILQNQFKNYQYLYNILGKQKLKVPLMHLCQINGFIGLIKTTSQYKQTKCPFPQIQNELNQLTNKLKYQNNLKKYFQQHIFQLNEQYYQQFNQNNKKQGHHHFHYYFIDNVQPLFLYDHIIQSNSEQYFRKQLAFLDQFNNHEDFKRSTTSNSNSKLSEGNMDKQSQEIQKLSKQLLKSIADVVIEMENFQVFFFNSGQFSDYLHKKGINIRYLGYIYDQLTTDYQKKFILSQIAARSCKNLHRKTFQDQMIEQKRIDQNTLFALCDFFNCITGKGQQTFQIWKVISNQSKYSFGVQINIEEIDKHHFAISLIENCRLNVNWQKIHPQIIFRQHNFFTKQNFLGINIRHKKYEPYYSQGYMKYQAVNLQRSKKDIQQLIQELNLTQLAIPDYLQDYSLSIKSLLTSNISPKQSQEKYSHLCIYSYSKPQKPSRLYFQIILNHIRWSLKLEQKYEYIRACDLFIRLATQFYGDFHPSFSQLYEVFSAYHLNKSENEDALIFAKSSLVNIIKLCGNNHKKTAQCYFHLALCYIKINKRQQAIFALIKAKSIYQHNNQIKYIPYGKICMKLALLYLNKHQIQQSISQITKSLAIFSLYLNEQSNDCQDQTIQCYQILYRCFQLRKERQQLIQLSLECYSKMKYITKIVNLQTALKIYLFPKIISIQQQNIANYTKFINTLSSKLSHSNKSMNEISFDYLTARIKEDKLQQNLKIYLSQLKIILGHIQQRNILRDWQSFKKIYQRETVNDFISLHQQIISFLGESQIVNILKEKY